MDPNIYLQWQEMRSAWFCRYSVLGDVFDDWGGRMGGGRFVVARCQCLVAGRIWGTSGWWS